jgi:hypothetical protein
LTTLRAWRAMPPAREKAREPTRGQERGRQQRVSKSRTQAGISVVKSPLA